MKITTISGLGVASLTFLISACSSAGNTTVNISTANAANKSNTAVIAGSNQTAVNGTTPASNANAAQSVSTPAKDSPERTAILDALRLPVSEDLKQEIVFTVEKLKVQGDWAFIACQPKNAKGEELNWNLTKYREFIDSGDFEQGLYGLLKRSNGKWSVVTYLMNCHDVCYLGWEKEYKAPKAIFK